VAELVLVRHASTNWSGRRFCGRADPPLNRAGQLAARRLAAELAAADHPVAGRIISSPARRARQTARAIARLVPGVRVELDERWSEADVGIAEGLTFDALAALEPTVAERLARGDADIDWPGGESASSLAERVWSAMRELDARDASSPTVVVSHAGPLRLAIALALDVPITRVAFLEPGGVLRVATTGRQRARTGPHATIPR
jgi:broad specificity phosphatase PhoE